MVNLCCTKEFLKRLNRKADASKASGSVLGDWYGKELRSGTRRHFVFMSNRTGISLILSARMHDLENIFRQHLGRVLYEVGASPIAIREELAHASDFNYTTSASRSSIGCLNEVVHQCQWMIETEPGITAESLEEYIFELPLGGPDYWWPRRDTLELLKSFYMDIA